MRNSFRTNVEFGAQIAIAISVVIVAGLLIKRVGFPQQPIARSVPSISAGERLNLRDVDWKQNKKSLVFFLKKDCHYCTSSAALYHQLLDDATKRNVRCIAVLPDSLEDARKYLQYLELPFENIYTGPVEDNTISGTPTVVFVDEGGIVKSVWIGAQGKREKEMRDTLVQLFDS